MQETIAEDAKVSSKLVLADFAAWRTATEAWVKEHNEIVKNGPTAEKQADSRRASATTRRRSK